MTASLPADVQAVFDRFVTTEYATIDGKGQPIAWPVTPYYSPGDPSIDVTTGLGYPKKARDAAANPRVALLFSYPKGSGLAEPPMVLVQGTADVDERDLEANRLRYKKESVEKLPSTADRHPPEVIQRRLLGWYYTRVYVHVRPERIYVWPGADIDREPELLDARVDEVRSGHSEEPERPTPQPEGGGGSWDERLDQLGRDPYDTAALTFVGPDGFPFAVRVPVRPDRAAGLVRIAVEPAGVPLQPGLACLTVHDHDDDFAWQRNFQARGDLISDADGWAVLPHKLVGGFDIPEGQLAMYRENMRKMRRFRRTAKKELARREGRS